MRSTIVSLISLLLTGWLSAATPFGLSPGMKLAEVEKLCGPIKLIKNGIYISEKVPKPHSRFEKYFFLITGQHGLSKIIAIGVTVNTSWYGEGLQNEFNNLKRALTKLYGTSRDFDFLKSGSIWDEPNEWTMALLRDERELKSYWLRQFSPKLPKNLSCIELKTHAESRGSGYITLTYEFTNAEAAVQSFKDKDNSAL